MDVLSGLAPDDVSVICLLFGSTTPIPDATLAQLYSTADAYEQAYADAPDDAITAGFVLADDRPEFIAAAQPDRILR